MKRAIIIAIGIFLLAATQAHAQATVEQCIRATPTGPCNAVSATNPLPTTGGGSGTTAGQIQGNAASGAADVGNPVKTGGVYNLNLPTPGTGQRVDTQMDSRGGTYVVVKDVSGSNGADVSNAGADGLDPTSFGGLYGLAFGYYYNGATFDRARGDTTNGAWVNVKTMAVGPDGIGPGAITDLGPQSDNVCATDTGVCSLIALIKKLNTNVTSAIPAGTNTIGSVNSVSQYPATSIPVTHSATGTTAATAATLPAHATKTTYICGFSIRANATAAATGNSTVAGTISGTLNFTQWTAPNASGIGITEMIFSPCVPGGAVNTAIVATSAAPGAGGVVSVSAWGYQL